MEVAVRGGPDGGPALELDHERFAYAGKFRMTNTGKAVARDGGAVIGAVAFNRDRTDDRAVWFRYVTVRDDRRGEGVGARLAAAAAERLLADADTDRIRIAVNNPFAYEALYKAGFGYTGDRTGIAELVLARPGDRSGAAYRDGLAVFEARDGLSGAERSFLSARGESPPAPILE